MQQTWPSHVETVVLKTAKGRVKAKGRSTHREDIFRMGEVSLKEAVWSEKLVVALVNKSSVAC